MTADPGLGQRAAGAPDEDVERELRNARHAYARVRTEALRYRDDRDAARERVAALTAELRELKERLRQSDQRRRDLRSYADRLLGKVDAQQRRIDELKRRVEQLRGRIAQLEASRAVRAEERVRRLRRRLSPTAGPEEAGRAAEPAPAVQTAAAPDSDVPAAAPAEQTAEQTAAQEPVAEPTTFGAWHDLDAHRLAARGDQAAAASARLREAEQRGGRLRVAAVVDDFTRLSLGPECELVNLDAGRWREQLEELQPDLLFVESAWRGHDGTWRDLVASLSQELQDVFAWCRQRTVPTVFWNKEDPVHFERYLRVAAEADFVFTTDIDRIAPYRLRLGHDRVALLPFAAQPRAHNPLEIGTRREALAFAGAYYPEFADRMRDLRALVTGAAAAMPVEIYDRNYGTTVETAMFPPEYEPYIVGTLGPEEIEIAYKGYLYGLNLNTVKGSRSMFARRVFELLASNTVTVSNTSTAVHHLFGDLVPMSDDADTMRATLTGLVADRGTRDRMRALGVRKVLREHTYGHRFGYVVATVAGRAYEPPTPYLTVVVAGDDAGSVLRRTERARAQHGVRVAVTVVTGSDEVAGWAAGEQLTTIAPDRLDGLALADLLAPGSTGIAVLHDQDWYGEDYLRDLADAWTYADADVVGKDQHYRLGRQELVEVDGSAYVPVTGLRYRSSLVAAGAAAGVSAAEALSGGPVPDALTQLAIHRFDFCEGDAADEATASSASAELPIDTGATLDEVWAAAAAVEVDRSLADAPVVLPAALDPVVDEAQSDRLRRAHVNDWLLLRSELDEDEEATVHGRARLDVAAAWPAGEACFGFRADGDLDPVVLIEVYDNGDRLLDTLRGGPGANHRAPLPAGARWARVGWQVAGPGRVSVSPLHLSPWPFDAPGGGA